MNKQEAEIQEQKQIISSNIHLMQMYLDAPKKLTHKTAMKKTVEQLDAMYKKLVPEYQKKVKQNWIDEQLEKEFNMKDYLDGDTEFDDQVDLREEELMKEEGYMYLGMFWNVIYTIDIHLNRYQFQEYGKREPESTLKEEKPKCVKKPTWYVTETEVEDPEYFFTHRKYCADDITTKQLIEFLDEVEFDETNNTLGAVTLLHGTLPAISFNKYEGNTEHNAYVSPLMIDDQLNELYIKYAKLNWESAEAKDMQRVIGGAIDNMLKVLKESTKEGFKTIPSAVRVSKPITLSFKEV